MTTETHVDARSALRELIRAAMIEDWPVSKSDRFEAAVDRVTDAVWEAMQ